MDPLTIRLENALHEANASAQRPDGAQHLVNELNRIVGTYPRRVGGPVEISQASRDRIVLRRGAEQITLSLGVNGWTLEGTGVHYSGPGAAALTIWLAGPPPTNRRL